jgi:hypothetical protein
MVLKLVQKAERFSGTFAASQMAKLKLAEKRDWSRVSL